MPLLIALALAAYGVYHGLYAVGMVVSPGSPLMLFAFTLQAVLAILAAVCVWRHSRHAAALLLLLGASVAATELLQAFVLGIVAWLPAVLVAIAAIVIALLLAIYVNRSGSLHDRRRGSPLA